MKLSPKPPAPRWRQARRRLALLLASGALPAVADARFLPWPSGGAAESRPYLTVLGRPWLNFAKPLPPPSPAPITAPPEPEPDPAAQKAAALAAAAAQAEATAPTGTPPAPADPASSDPGANPAGHERSPLPAPSPSRTTPASDDIPSILPDEHRTVVRPEDILPYFQFPSAPPPPSVQRAPAPGTLPPSSATYRVQ